MTIHEQYGLKRVINAWGKATRYGTSRTPEAIAEATAQALRHFFDMAALDALVSQEIADFTGAEAGCLTHCTAAGIALAAAACIAGSDPGRISQLPNTDGMRSKIVLQAAHNIFFGASVAQMLRLAGAQVVLVGAANRCQPHDITHALRNGDVAAVFFVESRLAPQHGSLPLATVCELAHSHDVPVLVDAAAQDQRLPDLLQQGADLVLSGAQKYLRGPTAGLVAGSRELVEALRAQHHGVGRAMKPSKEAIFGTLAALHYRRDNPAELDPQKAEETVAYAAQKLNEVPGLTATPQPDPNGNPFPLLRLDFAPQHWPMPLPELVQAFAQRDPIIALAPHFASVGYLLLELHELPHNELDELAAAFHESAS